ncbi:hypothetical protein [Paraburkholderia nemoris]|uniref:Uncharacterized protein n=1 Tax=Paraburkholderia nemoris TaxID=2793076 RepID=A0ABN7LKA5_9BURK|nr:MULTISPECIES: hypothetical protein [Paraburkholderia]MBK3812828.1 hypothetical protein [Paraburkholderia aspalathi]CAE6752856.1 hypothetical protein R69776_03008 [Paraburkholderia nemoris]CAE6830358.1 hypothetical protein R75777_06570 [Paraburkholderia nemoris]
MNKRGAYQKKAENKENVEARHALLEAGLTSPDKISKYVVMALENQHAFCSLKIPNLKIAPISLNTLKSLAGDLYSKKKGANGNGFVYLDAMRVRLKKLVENTTKGRSVEAKAQRREKRESELAEKIRGLEVQDIHRSKAYFDLYSKLKAFIKEDAIEETIRLRLFQLLTKHDDLYGSLFNPRRAPSSGDSAVLIAWPGQQEE